MPLYCLAAAKQCERQWMFVDDFIFQVAPELPTMNELVVSTGSSWYVRNAKHTGPHTRKRYALPAAICSGGTARSRVYWRQLRMQCRLHQSTLQFLGAPLGANMQSTLPLGLMVLRW